MRADRRQKDMGTYIIIGSQLNLEVICKLRNSLTSPERPQWNIVKTVGLIDLEPDKELKAEIEQRKEKRSKDIAENPRIKGDRYWIAQRKGFVTRDWSDSYDPYNREEYLQ